MNPLSCLIAWRSCLSNSNKEKESSELDDVISEVSFSGFYLLASNREDMFCSFYIALPFQAFNAGWQNDPHPVLRTLLCLADESNSASSCGETFDEPFSLSERLGFNSSKQGEELFHWKCDTFIFVCTELVIFFPGGKQTRIYPYIHPDVFKPPAWMNLSHSVSSLGGYATSFPFNKEPGEGLSLFKEFVRIPQKA